MVIWPLEIILYFSIFLMKGKILCYKIVYIYVSSSNRNCAEFDVIITNAKDSKKASGLSKSVSL